MAKFNVRDKRRVGYFRIDNELLREGWGAKLGAAGIAVYNALALHSDVNTQSSYPSQTLIARLIGVSRKTVNEKVKLLQELNIIVAEGKQGESLTYYLLDKSEWGGVTPGYRGCNEELQEGVTPGYTNNTHDNNTQEQQDYLSDVVKKTKENILNGKDNIPPGYRDATEEEYRICERVAMLWTDNQLPRFAADIERNLAAAKDILNLHSGDLRATLRTLDEHHLETADDGLTITGPYSLRNVIPSFLAQHKKQNGRTVVKVGR